MSVEFSLGTKDERVGRRLGTRVGRLIAMGVFPKAAPWSGKGMGRQASFVWGTGAHSDPDAKMAAVAWQVYFAHLSGAESG